MDKFEADQRISEEDARDHSERVQRLLELADLLPTGGLAGYSGQAASWLFDDVKATWLYGYFASTIVTAHAFCTLQLANSIRLLVDDHDRSERATSLEDLAAMAARYGIIDVAVQSRVVQLHDRAAPYMSTSLDVHETLLERHLAESEVVSGEHPLLLDARHALVTAVALLYRED